jgi:hypothetical protein
LLRRNNATNSMQGNWSTTVRADVAYVAKWPRR